MSKQAIPQNTEAAILSRLIQMRQDDLSRGVAEYLLSFRFDDGDIARMDELAELGREGKLTDVELAELDSYVHAGNLLAVMQSKARRALNIPGAVGSSG